MPSKIDIKFDINQLPFMLEFKKTITKIEYNYQIIDHEQIFSHKNTNQSICKPASIQKYPLSHHSSHQQFIQHADQNVQTVNKEFACTNDGQLNICETLNFSVPNNTIKRDSKCIIQISDRKIRQSQKSVGQVQFGIMDYKNYSKTAFILASCSNAVLYMNLNICPSDNSLLHVPPPQLKTKSRISEHNSVSLNVPAKTERQLRQNTSMNRIVEKMVSPIPDIRLICPSQFNSQKQQKSMFSAFQDSGIVVQSKMQIEKQKDVELQKKNNNKKSLSSLGQIFQKKEDLLKVPEKENLAKSCRLAVSRGAQDSRYCKEIQQNLNNLSALDDETSKLSMSRSPLKGEQCEYSIFDTLNRMKIKFQKIHQKETILNHQPYLDMLLEQNEQKQNKEDSQQDLKLMESVSVAESIQQSHLSVNPSIVRRDSDVNCQSFFVNSPIKQKNKICSKTINIIVSTASKKLKKNFKMLKTISVKIQGSSQEIIESDIEADAILTARVHPHIKSSNNQLENSVQMNGSLQNSSIDKRNTYMSQTYRNFEVQEESLRRVAYIKLNKMNHLSKAADISKRRNAFLVKANDQMIFAQKKLDQKLQLSKKLIDEKEDMIGRQFETLKTQIDFISKKLSETNEQSVKREAKIKSLQNLLENGVRQNNQLKEQLKTRSKHMQQLRSLLSHYQEQGRKKTQPENQDEGHHHPLTTQPVKQEVSSNKHMLSFFTHEKRSISGEKTNQNTNNFNHNRKYSIQGNFKPTYITQFQEINRKSVELPTQKTNHKKNVSFNTGQNSQIFNATSKYNDRKNQIGKVGPFVNLNFC